MQENTRGWTILGKTVPGEVWDGREAWRRMMMVTALFLGRARAGDGIQSVLEN